MDENEYLLIFLLLYVFANSYDIISGEWISFKKIYEI